MKRRALAIIGTLLSCAVILAISWWWSQNMVQVPKAVPTFSREMLRHPYAAATRFLQSQGVQVEQRDTLNLVMDGPLKAGVLLIGDYEGLRTAEESQTLMDWVAQGGVLVVEASWHRDPNRKKDEKKKPGDEDDDEEVATSTYIDPTYTLFKTGRHYIKRDKGADLFTLPGSSYPLRLVSSNSVLHTLPGAPTPLWADAKGLAVRAYAHGKGQVVLLSMNRFDRFQLAEMDHAELLLRLARLNGDKQAFLLVNRLDVRRWYVLMWERFSYGLLALPLVLLLMLWAALPRFGPRLPDLAPSRRALLEHIDAAARWQWRSQAGRQQLLDAMRLSLMARLQRQAPKLLRLSAAERLQALAKASEQPTSLLAQALDAPAASQPAAFTEQIRTLQTLRKHHER